MKAVRYRHYDENPLFPRKRERRVSPGQILVALLLLAGFSTLLWGPWFRVRYVAIEGNAYVQTAEVERIANDALHTRFLWLFPKDNTLFFSRSSIEHALTATLMRAHALEFLHVTTRAPVGLTVEMKERIPNLYYTVNAREYTLDRKGVITERIDEKKPREDFPRVFDQNSRDVAVGEMVVSETFVEYLFTLDEALKNKTIAIKDYYIPPLSCFAFQKPEPIEPRDDEEGSTNENTNTAPVARLPELVKETCESGDSFVQNKEVRVRTGQGWEIYARTDEDPTIHLNRLFFVLEKKNINREALHYIDLRFGETVVFQ